MRKLCNLEIGMECATQSPDCANSQIAQNIYTNLTWSWLSDDRAWYPEEFSWSGVQIPCPASCLPHPIPTFIQGNLNVTLSFSDIPLHFWKGNVLHVYASFLHVQDSRNHICGWLYRIRSAMEHNIFWGRGHTHCIDVSGIRVSTQCIKVPPLKEVLQCFERGNIIKYPTECLISTTSASPRITTPCLRDWATRRSFSYVT